MLLIVIIYFYVFIYLLLIYLSFIIYDLHHSFQNKLPQCYLIAHCLKDGQLGRRTKWTQATNSPKKILL